MQLLLAAVFSGTLLLAAEPATLETPTGKIYGTLELPSGDGPFPVVVIHAGSGPTDRDGNTPALPGKNDSLKMLAEALAAHGIASLRY
ncbi:MAG: alpha/beta hydrolase, partial [Bryobacteraceae bacterium]